MSRLRLLPMFVFLLAVACGEKPSAESSAGSSAGAKAPAAARLRIAMVPKGTTHVFWKAVESGARQAADELGVDLVWKGPLSENDRAGQIQLVQQLLADMPRTEPHQKPPFELWQRRSLESPRFLPELNLVALDGDDYVGMSNFWRDLRPGHIGTGLTGVLASHRRRGLATALKVRALSAARAAGFKVTTTWNAAENAGMLGINRRLGFTARPAWMELELTLAAEEGESVGA